MNPSVKRRLRRVGLFGLCLLFLLFSAIALNTVRFRSQQESHPLVAPVAVDASAAVDRLSQSLRFRTVSEANQVRRETSEFIRFQEYVAGAFPLTHARLKRLTGKAIGDAENYSLLYCWEGKDPQRPGILLMGHYDVVPIGSPDDGEAAGGAAAAWTHPPFAGSLADGFIWGRGTLDCKHAAIGLLEAVEHLLAQGFQPAQSIYLSLGHDEEVGGLNGNRRIAEWMRSQGIRLEFVLDEGGCILEDFPQMDRPVALIGVAEKGWVSIRMHVELAADQAGHAAMPSRQSAIWILAAALHRLDQQPFPLRLDGGVGDMLDHIGPEMPWLRRMVLANRWLFGPYVKQMLAATDSGRATLQTTMVPTILKSGYKDNVVPRRAEAVLNLRLLPGDRIESALQRVEQVIDDPRVKVERLSEGKEASRFSASKATPFEPCIGRSRKCTEMSS